jgi:hypothetical protein
LDIMIRLVLVFVVLAPLFWPVAAPAADANYAVDSKEAIVTVGEIGKARVTISARGGWHFKAEAPLTLKLSPAKGVAMDKRMLERADLVLRNDTSAIFVVGVVASAPGKKAIAAEAGFEICRDAVCRPIKERIKLAVVAAARGKHATGKKPGVAR